MEVLIALGVVSLLLAVRASWWAVAIPGAIVLLGAVAYSGSEPNPPGGGDSDPAGLVGIAFLSIGSAWLVIALVIVVAARAIRSADDSDD